MKGQDFFRQSDNLLDSDCDSIQSIVFKHGTCFSISLLCSDRLESLQCVILTRLVYDGLNN